MNLDWIKVRSLITPNSTALVDPLKATCVVNKLTK
ncbi:hypothetical protein Q783_07415 [Carnobacterium inhibens subsp. gilichinskyi]|uniref:Uncharacterized protein n=1 Tax=Carnobacterium inhibens subsp. gilichinskyi TaxID=1266845 RepID=U5SFF7_9LACT|nr:hypothetical protein Q783_07415 [Carnobacterium inhibens subsp. gilichinskyi]